MNRLKSIRSQGGFTLLELLVVIAIIAILAAVVITNLSSARSKANDSKVQTDLNSLAQAVNVATTTATDFTAFDTGGVDKIGVGGLETAVVGGGFIKKMPTHPVTGKAYHYKGDDTNNDGIFEYVLYGEMSTAECFIVANGSSFTGDCVADIAL